MEKFIGLDAGSVSVKIAILDTKRNILKTSYVRHKGKPVTVAYELLRDIQYPASISITGSGGRLIAQALNVQSVNEVIAQNYSTKTLYPDVRTIIEMGGEDSKLILLENGKVKEFSMNSVCAAGTGSFLDQQAERLRLSIEEFSRVALESKNPPRIAGRCSVFAKSDMIHLQQIATPLKDIVSGLCFAVARNFKGSICKNMTLPLPISFQGGVAANKGVVRAFKEVFELDSLLIPEHFALMPAIGAALIALEQGIENRYDIEGLRDFLSSWRNDEKGFEPLKVHNQAVCNEISKPSANHDDLFQMHSLKKGVMNKKIYGVKPQERNAPIQAFLGIDIGSISTNLAVIDEKGRLLAKRYLMTAGRPIEAVKQGLDEIGHEIGDNTHILGVGTTGSGRYMIADFVGADIVKNEITAQAQAAVEIDPEVDTIFEIGGQDSKYISLKDGIIVDFEMNKACAAGTGSFLEEQAEKLDISIKEEFSDLAFRSQCPSSLGERCTVFMENSLLARLQRGAPKEDLIAGLSYSIVQNYINRVVGDKVIGDKIFFQGGVAFNKAVVSAFEAYLNKKIIAPPHHDVTGAVGMAIIAMRHMKSQSTAYSMKSPFQTSSLYALQKTGMKAHETDSSGQCSTSFKGFDLSKRSYELRSFECKGCDNMCEINKVKVQGEKESLYYGSRCEKYDVKRRKKYSSSSSFPDLFSERQSILTEPLLKYEEIFKGKAPFRIGMPRIFFFHDFFPFWITLLSELGFKVELSPETNRNVIKNGIESILAESCFPHKVAHGHIKDLLDKELDAILIPSFINFSNGKESMRSLACPYAQTIPYFTNLAFKNNGVKILRPVIDMEHGTKNMLGEIHKALKPFRISKKALEQAFVKAEKAQHEFTFKIKRRGREILETLSEKTIVIVGRSYNAFDPGLNLEIPRKLSTLGIFSIPMDYLPIEHVDIARAWPNMYWRSGQNILKAAEIIRKNPNLFGIYIGNFSCGPDSFIHRFFKKTMGDKPFLQIEIDEHSADAGIITRCEAFLDSIKARLSGSDKSAGASTKSAPYRDFHDELTNGHTVPPVNSIPISSHLKKRIVYLPRMSDHALGLAAAFESCGVDAEVMDASDIETVKTGRRFVSGKECYPCLLTTGDMVKKIQSNGIDPRRVAFFMPSGSGPCRFGQYNILHRFVLDRIGYPEIPIFSPNQDTSLYEELGIIGDEFIKQAWKGIIATELLMKTLHEGRPYEINKGETDALYKGYLLKISRMVKSQNGAFNELLKEIPRAFAMIPKAHEKKPLIGIIGEIFVRHNAFSNENIVRKIESLGGEVWLAPFEEWMYYLNMMALRKAQVKWKNNLFSKKNVQDILRILTTRFFQKRIEHKFSKPFKGYLKTLKEPSTKEIIKNASPYLHDSFEGEAILSIGKAIDFVKIGASGIINVMPFGCMPGTIVSALLKGLKQDTGIPCLNIAYDGTEGTCSEIQLEAFMHQAYEYKKVESST
jgi:predicted CoA-substrate-specific enzyme activase